MGTVGNHRRCAEECVAKARAAADDTDKVLWLMLAQSWLRLAEDVAHLAGLPGGVTHTREDEADLSSD